MMVASTSTARDFALAGAVAAAVIFAYRDALRAMIQLWNVSPMYSYGFTVPLISAYLLWTRRDVLSRLSPNPSWVAGGAVVVLAVAMAAVARNGSIQLLDQLGFLVALTAAVLILFGAAYAKVAWAALAYLLLMIPVWDGFTEPLHEPFQRRSAEIGVWILQRLGVPAHREGVFIDLSTMNIEVARACSGVNYLVAVVALGLPLSYLFLRGVWRRVLLLVFAVGVAAFSNGLRVALIGLLVHLGIGSPLHGPFHVLHGLFVAGIGYVALFAGLRFLSSEKAPRDARQTPDDAGPGPGPVPQRRALSMTAAVALTTLFIGVGVNAFWRAPETVNLNAELNAFPNRLGEWFSDGAVGPAPATADFWRGADSSLLRRYRRADGATIDLYVGYFASQRQNKEIINSQAAGLHRNATAIRLGDRNGGVLEVNQTTARPDGLRTLFWYHVDGTPEVDPQVIRWKTLWNSMWRGRSNGAVLVLTLRRDGARGGDALRDFGLLVEEALASRLSGHAAAGAQES